MMARARADKDALARERDRKKADELQVCYTVGYRYLSFFPIVSLQFSCCDLSVREKDWHGKPGL